MSRFEPKQADEPLRIETSGSAPKQTVASRYGAGEPLGGLAATKRLRRCTVIPFNPLFVPKRAPQRVYCLARVSAAAPSLPRRRRPRRCLAPAPRRSALAPPCCQRPAAALRAPIPTLLR